MKRVVSFLKYLRWTVFLCVFTLILFSVFGKMMPNQPLSNELDDPNYQVGYPQPPDDKSIDTGYPSPLIGKNLETAYPPPIDLIPTLSPTLEFTPTEIDPLSIPESESLPFTPYPTPTLRPGPSPTPIPIRIPAKDASGNIFFAAKHSKEDQVNFYTMVVGADGKLIESSTRQTEGETLSDAFIFPSPDGSRMAILRPWGLLTIYNTYKGKIEKQEFSIGSSSLFFNWFPDNRNILYESLAFKDVISEETTTLVVPGFGGITGAAASPDGRFVLYGYTNTKIYERGLWIVNTNGQNHHYFGKTMDPNNISWSPDGKRIAFYGWGWQLIDADGTNLQEIAPNIILPQCYPFPPLWSPDSSSLAIATSKSGESFCQSWSDKLFEDTNIFIIDVVSGDAQPLLKDGSLGNIDPAWSPDGKQLVFVSNRSGKPEIWAVNRDGVNLRKLTDNDLEERYPFWYKSEQ